jgi:hydroxymethylbilane synthase
METIRLIGRSSRLSLLQLEKVKNRINDVDPTIKVEIIARISRGDELQDIPLQTVEGSDFFTQDIFDALSNGEADIAVHSLKDMSSEHFFGTNRFAVVDRDDTRDIAIFSKATVDKIRTGNTIIIGTCSPRREEMAIGFLQKALPKWDFDVRIETKTIRGNVDTRLRKLDAGEYDGIILATAGLNRLLKSSEDAPVIKDLLANKKLVLLPLIECVPAPCQGAIVAEANPLNKKALAVLDLINDKELMEICVQEKKTAIQYGVGCLQRFGVTSISYGNNQVVYAAGKDSEGFSFHVWNGLPGLEPVTKNIFSATDHMGSFFRYEYTTGATDIKETIAYIANYKAVWRPKLVEQLQAKKVWAAGTKTWFELAKKGIWVEGCADAFGLEFLQGPWQMPLFNIAKEEVAVITNKQSADVWQAKGWNAYGTYNLVEENSPLIEDGIKNAGIIFWTSYRQYLQYKEVVSKDTVHTCPYGETAEQLRAAGVEPVVFPNIKAFQQWRQISIPSPSVA